MALKIYKKDLAALLCVIILLIIITIAFFGTWYSSHIINESSEGDLDMYLSHYELTSKNENGKSKWDISYSDSRSFYEEDEIGFFNNVKYLLISSLILAILALLTIFFISLKGNEKINKFRKIGAFFSIVACALFVVIIFYFMNESTNFFSEAISRYNLLSGNNIEYTSGFWNTITADGGKIILGPGYAWYLIIVSVIISAISSVLILKKPKGELLKVTKKQKRMAVASFIIAILIIFSFFNWFFYTGPLDIYELANRHFEPGNTVDVEGTISSVETIDTNYGNFTVVKLDQYSDFGLSHDTYPGHSEAFKIRVDSDEEYNVGDKIQKTLHFEDHKFNDNCFLSAKEFILWQDMPTAIANAIDATSYIAGFILIHKTLETNYSLYEVFTLNEDSYPLSILNVTLLKGKKVMDVDNSGVLSETVKNTIEMFANEYVYVSGGGYDETQTIDFMQSLEDGVSQEGLIEFIDNNSNNLLDDHDIFKINIPATDDETVFESYLLTVGTKGLGGLDNIAAGVKYIINWHKGPFEHEVSTELLSLSYLSEEENGSLIDTTFEVSRVNPVMELNYSNYQVNLDGSYISGTHLSEGNKSIKDNISVEFIDSNKNELLDVGDILKIKGLENKSYVTLNIYGEQTNIVVRYPWIVGYGHIIGNIPEIELEDKGLISGDSGQYKIEVSPSFWHPELAISLTSKISLYKDDELILDNVSINDGVIGSYNGKNVSFIDFDNNSYISSNDYFIIENEPSSTYLLEFSLLFGASEASVQIFT